nr:nuclear pore complex protein Nup160 homolog isoform X2 [Vanessa tameamea]
MEFVETIPVTFKEITPNYNIPEKWKEIVLNTGGTHSTLQDIKLPHKAGGYWYRDSKKANTRNRFIYWQTTSDSIELSEASLDVNLSLCNLRCKVAAGTPPLNNLAFYERTSTQQLVILAATVSSVHRLIFPHPDVLDRKSTFGPIGSVSPSIFHDTNAVNNPNNYHILNQYSNTNTGVAHSCASLLRDNGEAVFALAFGYGGDGGLLLVKLPVTGSAVTTILKRESTVPRFLSGITGALRGKSGDGVDTYGVVLINGLAVAVCGDTCLRAWLIDEGGSPTAVSAPLSQTLMRPKPPPHGHMLQDTTGSDGSTILVAYLSFPNECEFVVMKMHDGGAGAVKFSQICQIFGPQLDLLDYKIGYGEGNHVIWALWTQPDGDAVVTSSALGAEVSWRAVAAREPPPALPQLSSHLLYRDRLLAPGLFPTAVVMKALVIYRRTWGGSEAGAEIDLSESCMSAVQARMRGLTARAASQDHSHLMHKCWSDLYSWCMQYMEGLQKPLGLMVSKHSGEAEGGWCGWWCALVRRCGVSFVRQLEPLERIMLSPEDTLPDVVMGGEAGELSADAVRVVVAGARWERAASAGGAADLERRLFACAAPQHRLLPRLLHLLLAAAPQDHPAPVLTSEQIDEITSILEPIKDLQNAVLELNDALRLDVPEIDTCDDDETSEYDNLFASDLGVAVVTEAIRQMAEMRARVVRGALAALGAARGAGGVPGAGHCAVHWQAYRALLWLRAATPQRPSVP